jgi:protein tyrosine phosphatase
MERNRSRAHTQATRRSFDPDEEKKLEKEFRQLNEARKHNMSVIDEKATTPNNIHKNRSVKEVCIHNIRYEDVLPYKDTVVRLLRLGTSDSDYINANFVQDGTTCRWLLGFVLTCTAVLKKQMYICSQAPLSHTIADFWRMVWEQRM